MSDSSNRRPDGIVTSTNIDSSRQTTEQHKRNTSGLKQNQSVSDYIPPPCDNYDDDPERPF